MDNNATQEITASPNGISHLSDSERPADRGRSVASVGAMNDGGAMISMIERAARDPSVDLDKMERLFAMKERMEAAQARQRYLSAFSDLQRVLPAVAKRGMGHDKTKYARFEDIVDTIKEPLAKLGFSLSFRLNHSNDSITVTGVLGHSGGHSESTSMCLPADPGPRRNAVQAWGSAVTYGKRYVALTLLGIATQDDDDGNAAVKGPPAPVTEQDIADLRKALTDKKVHESIVLEEFSVAELSDLSRVQFDKAVYRLSRTQVRK